MSIFILANTKNPEDLTGAQAAKLESLKKRAGSRLFRAWELKEDLRAVFRAGTAAEARSLLAAWLHDAAYCRIKPVVAVEKKVRRRRADIAAAVELGISNGRVESINNKVKVTVRMAYGFRNTDNLIALLMLRCSDAEPQLPGRPEGKRKGAAVGGGQKKEGGLDGLPTHTNYRRLKVFWVWLLHSCIVFLWRLVPKGGYLCSRNGNTAT